MSAIPPGRHTVGPHLVVRNAAEAIEFYKKAFGAQELSRMPTPDGKFVLHAELQIGDSVVMLCDEFPGMERWVSPQSLDGTTVALHIWCEKVDAAFKRAVKAGARVSMPLADMFWGDRYGRVTDPFGHEWSLGAHIRDLTPAEITKAAEAYFKEMECK
jgi:uncharacterized glyoxalase superfamily protein PhnB